MTTDIDTTSKIHKTLLNVILMVDTSITTHIYGRIGSINAVINELANDLREFENNYLDYIVQMALMTFDQNSKWEIIPTNVGDLSCIELYGTTRRADFGKALHELRIKLNRKEFMYHIGKLSRPIIILITDGGRLFDGDYLPEVDMLCENGWFQHSIRLVAFVEEGISSDGKFRTVFDRFSDGHKESIVMLSDLRNTVTEMIKPLVIGGKANNPRSIAVGDDENSNEEIPNFSWLEMDDRGFV